MAKDIKVKLYSNSKQFNSEMSSISRQMKVVKSEFEANKSSVDNWGNKLKQSESSLKFLNQTLNLQKTRVNELRKAYNDSANVKGRDAKETQNLAVRLNNANAALNKTKNQITQTTQKMKQLETSTKRSAISMRQFGDRINNTGMKMRSMGTSVGIVSGLAFAGIAREVKKAYDATTQFEAGMSSVQAISGATADELKLLDKQARDLGASTRFTATQATEGMEKLALAGWKTQEIMAGMPGMLNLAAAGNLELAVAADITSDTMAAFGLEAKNAGHAADVFAYAQANANTNVEQMGEAMKYAAPVANALGWELEETAAAQMALADSGIKGSLAGQAFATSLSRLAKPTSKMSKEMKRLGMDFFDANGNMKPMPKLMAEVEKGTKGMTREQKSATLSIMFGAEAYKHWAILLERGSKELAKTTEELKNADGAAEKMAKTMMDNARGKVIEFQSAIEGLQISITRHLMPGFSEVIEEATGWVRTFTDLDESTQKTIATTLAMTAAVLGVTTVVAGLTAAVGALMAFAGPVGLAIVGGTALLGAMGVALLAAKTHTEALKEVNLDTVESLSEQAIELENNANVFEKLSNKAKISNSELAALHDLNSRIANTKNSDEVAKLQAQYDKLAEKSGLSKGELKQLFNANEEIIKQSPDVAKSVSEQGNAFVENTDAVREYVDTLYEMSRVQLDAERVKQLNKETKLRKDIEKQQNIYIEKEKELQYYLELQKKSKDELYDRQDEINELYYSGNLSEAEKLKITKEYGTIQDALTGKVTEEIEERQKGLQEQKKTVNSLEDQLTKIEAMDQAMANIRLKQAGINEEGEKGIIALEKKLTKNGDTLANLDTELEKNGKLTEEQQEQYENIVAQNNKMKDAQTYINEELKLYGSVNSLVESQRNLLSEGTQEKIKSLEKTLGIKVAEGDVLEQIQKKNSKLVEEREQLEKNREAQGANKKEIDKQISAIDKKINAGDGVILQMLKELDLLELVKDGIQLNGTELQGYLEGLGYTTGEAFKLAQTLSGETVKALQEGEVESKEAGKKKGDAFNQGVNSTKGPVIQTSTDLRNSLLRELGKGNSESEKLGKDKGLTVNKGLNSTKGTIIQTSIGLRNSLLNEMEKGNPEANKAGKSKGDGLKTGLQSKKTAVESAARTLSTSATKKLGSTTDGGGGKKAGSLFRSGISSQSGAVNAAAKNVSSSGERGLRSIKTSGAGSDFVSGFRRSISRGGGSVWSAAWSLGKSALSALKRSIDSHSPSKLTAMEGVNYTDGFALGIKKQTKYATKSAIDMAKEIHKAFSGEMDNSAFIINAAAQEIRANKSTLTIKNEVESSSLKSEISSLKDELKNLADLFKQSLHVQSQHLLATDQQPIILEVDGHEAARALRKPITEMQNQDKRLAKRRKGK